MSEFIVNNWSYIVLGLTTLSLIFNVVILLYKKVPLNKIVKVLSIIPSLINQAEGLFPGSQSGELKRNLVIQQFDDLLSKYGISRYKKYINIENLLEDILKTPQKKFDD